MLLEINEKEYERLFNKKMDGKTSWKFKSDLFVNLYISSIEIKIS